MSDSAAPTMLSGSVAAIAIETAPVVASALWQVCGVK